MLDLAIRAARAAGRVLASGYAEPHQIHVKGFRDIATEADLAAETEAIRVIREGCPGARFVSEESNTAYPDESDQPTWYIDPLDGTTNYARGLPMFSVSVGMVQRGLVQCGAVYDPLLDQLFYAERGQGSYLQTPHGEQRLQVSSCQALIDCLVTLDWPRDQALRALSLRFLSRLATQVDTVRSRGSAALGLCGVAAGWADVYFQYALGPWDVAAGVLIAEEAGARVTDLRGGPYALHGESWLASNGLVHQAILDLDPYGARA